MYAGLNALGFSDSQRAKLVAAAEPVVQGIRISPLAAFWPFEVLSRREGIQEDVVEVSLGLTPSIRSSRSALHGLLLVVRPAFLFVICSVIRPRHGAHYHGMLLTAH